MPFLPARTPAFEAFVAPAGRRPALWRLAAGALLAAAVWVAGGTLLGLAVAVAGAGPVSPRAAILIFLGSFAALILGLALALRLLHDRSLGTLLGPAGFRPRQFAIGYAVVAALAGLAALPLHIAFPPERQAGLWEWVRWLPLALPLVLVQTAAEELAFRGYLLQGLAARFRSRLVWWVLPALTFGLLHWNPRDFGGNAWAVALSAALIGLILADVTVRTGNLSLAIGLHFANNAFALLLVAMPSPLAALSLYVSPVTPSDVDGTRLLLVLDLALTLGAYGAWMAICARAGR